MSSLQNSWLVERPIAHRGLHNNDTVPENSLKAFSLCIDKNIPIINKLNPASMITDGFYSLYYYDTYDRFYFNLISLLIFAFVMIGISIFRLRRQKYDSI